MSMIPANRQPKTVRERLDDGRRLQSTIRSQSMYSFDHARAGWVERPQGAGREWADLAASLGRFDKDLNDYLDHRLDEQIESGIALGREAFNSPASQGEDGLRLDFKAWAEANPDQAGKNPFIVKGYEQSHLRQLGLEYQKELTDFYSTSGIRNESDPAKVDAAINRFTNQWYEKNGLNAYEDKLMLAGNFSPSVAAGRSRIMELHSADLSAHNLARIKTAFQQESAQLLQHISDTDLGGFNISHPDGRGQATVAFGQRVALLAQELANNGYPETEIPATILQMLESEAGRAAEEGDQDMLDLCQAMLGLEINGVVLDKLPGAAARMDRLDAALEDKAWQRAQRARTALEWQRQDAMRATFGYALDLGRTRDDLDIERILTDNPGWTPEQVNMAYDSAVKFRQSSFIDPSVNPQAKMRLFTASQRAIFGLDGPEALPGLLDEFGPHAESVYATLLADAATFTRSEREGLQSLTVFIAGLYDEDIKQFPERYVDKLDDGAGMEAFTQETQTLIQAAQAALRQWFTEQREQGKTPSQADIYAQVQTMRDQYQTEFRKRHTEEDRVTAERLEREHIAAVEAAEQERMGRARGQRNIHYLAQSSGVAFDAPLKSETQALIAPLLPDTIPMPRTQAELLGLLHTYYPAMTRHDFTALHLTTRGSVYDMGLMPQTPPTPAP